MPDGRIRLAFLADVQIGCMATFSGMDADAIGRFAQRGMRVRSFPRTESLEWDFPARAPVEGFRGAMVIASRAFEHLEALAERDFAVDPEHPDVDPRNEAAILRDAFHAGVAAEEVAREPEDFQAWMADSVRDAEAVVGALEALAAGQAGSAARADEALGRIAEACSDCHKAYRNH